MEEISFDSDAVELVNALDLDRTPTGIIPRRLPDWTRHQLVDPALQMLVTAPAGVRVRLRTDATELELDVLLTMFTLGDDPQRPVSFDLVADGEVVDGHATTEGVVVHIDTRTGALDMQPGEPTTIRFGGLPGRADADIEVWLPQFAIVELRALRVTAGTSVRTPPPSGRRRWIHYGSSISHCFEADRPTGMWPAVAALLAGVDLQSLALAGQCQLDQVLARTIRDLPADIISLKIGINLVNADSIRERTFVPALHGFLDTVRDGHLDTPILLVTPIFCPAAEDHPGPTVAGPDGVVIAVPRPPDLALGALTLTRIRTLIGDVVAARRQHGDANLHLLDGLTLFGPADVDDLPDLLHPNAAGYQRMGERFHAAAFAAGGALAP